MTKTKRITVGSVAIGGGARVSVQSMTNTDTRDVAATSAQINRLAEAGCDLIRLAVPNEESAQALKDISQRSPLPLVADIQFNWRLAVLSAPYVQKIRVNPGNIAQNKLGEVVAACRHNGLPIRVGVNGGSVKREMVNELGLSRAICQSALEQAEALEALGFNNICLSVKSSSVVSTVACYRELARTTSYPLHIGVTEAGTAYSGLVKSCAGLGALLLDGIGDTLRVSLSADPVEEVKAGIALLKAVGLRKGFEVISCPTCARTRIDVCGIAERVEALGITAPITVAVMGCAVNGPGEASRADIGLAGGDGEALLFAGGTPLRKVKEENMLEELVGEIRNRFAVT